MNVEIEVTARERKRSVVSTLKRNRLLVCMVLCAGLVGATWWHRKSSYVACTIHELAFMGYAVTGFLNWRLAVAKRKRFLAGKKVIEFWSKNAAEAQLAYCLAQTNGTWAEKQEADAAFAQARLRFAKEVAPILLEWKEVYDL